jgi:predicted aspartyl protease
MTEATINGVRTDIVIDTGAEASVGNRALQRVLARRNELRPVMLHSVTGHSVLADLTVARRLTIGNIHIQNPVLAFVDSPAFKMLNLERRPALLLGMREMRAFERVAIDFSARKVMFDLAPQR